MDEFPSEDLSQEIDRLWAKVASSLGEAPGPPPPAAPAPGLGQEAAWEAVSLLKSQRRHESRYWGEVLEAKERALKAARERQALLELEVGSLRQKLAASDGRLLNEGLEIQARLEAGLSALSAERARYEEELKGLKSILEQTRERMGAESSRFKEDERQWAKKEQQYLLDLRELQALSARYQDESGKSADQARRLSDTLKEAKNALEKTLAELLRERQIRADTEKERAEALKKVDEVQSHFAELSKLWEEERAQWRELWDRERSTWEAQRTEFSAWEENLRKEREAWSAEMRAKQEEQARYSAALSRSLRESAEATSKLSAMMKALGSGASRAAALTPFSRKALPSLIAAACLAAGGWLSWRHLSRLHLVLEASLPVELSSPTALAHDGTLLWVAEWDGRLLAFDPEAGRSPVRSGQVQGLGPYRPTALAFGGSWMWTLDAAGARVLRHKAGEPAAVVSARPSPGPAPTALAYDGEFLWSYDAANKALYRHGADEGNVKSFAADPALVVTAMAWVSGDLWVFDAKGRELVVLDFEEESFRLAGRHSLGEGVVGLSAPASAANGGGRLWVLAGPASDRPSHALARYRY